MSAPPVPTPPGEGFRCGIVALCGRPNAGKSTLLNALLGQKLAIVSHRAQTTRSRIRAVLTLDAAQLVLVDTPGVNRGQARFNLALSEAALGAARDADVRLLLFESGAEWDEPEARVADLPAPTLLVRTKCDLGSPGPVPAADLARFAEVIEISATKGEGLDALVRAIVSRLPESPPLYPPDTLTDRPLRFFAAELVREVAFELLGDELPYALAVEVQEWKEAADGVRIRADLLVERESQKGIVVGAGGRMLGEIGTEARRRISELVGAPVHLKLWVKTARNWRRNLRQARELGYL